MAGHYGICQVVPVPGCRHANTEFLVISQSFVCAACFEAVEAQHPAEAGISSGNWAMAAQNRAAVVHRQVSQ
jgi:hypothetical protein